MSKTIFSLTDDDRARLDKIVAVFESERAALAKHLHDIFFGHVLDNAHTLHPSRLAAYGSEEAESIIEFLKTGNTERAGRLGMQHAREGLGLSSIVAVHSFLNQYCLRKMTGEAASILPSALKFMDAYFSSSLAGYYAESKRQVFVQQNELREALSTALTNHRRELLIQKHALKNSINAIMFTDTAGNVTYINPAFSALWEYEKVEDVLGMPSKQLFVGDVSAEAFVSLSKQSNWRGELRAKRKNGFQFDVEMFASLILDEDGRRIGNMASFVDTTERKRLEAQSRQSHKMEALGHLAGSIAHDFNNMLAVIRSYLHVIAMDSDSQSQLFEDIVQVKMAVERGSGITKQLRLFSKNTSGEMAPSDLNAMISESYKLLKHVFQSDVQLELNLESKPWIVEADLSQLSHLLMNFCVNAKDAVEQKKSQHEKEHQNDKYVPKVEIKTRNVYLDEQSASQYLEAKTGRYVCLGIKDNGIGINAEVVDRIFEPFFSTKETEDNCGLGLSIVYGIIRQHKGFIDVQSKPGEGTSFDVFFPIPAIDDIPKQESDPPTPFASPQKETVLLVDDEAQVIAVLKRLLNACGYNVMTAENGKTAVSIYEKHQSDIDLVILDIIMPKMKGLECFRKMKEINPEVKVLINTGYTADDSAEQMIREGAVGIVEKPFDFHTFSNIIKKTISR